MVQNGSVGRICPQATPNWSPIASELEAYIIAGNVSSFNYTALNQELQVALQNAPPTPQTDGRATEDCLFLDVIVPKAVFDKANNPTRRRRRQAGGAPVIVW